MIYKNPYVPLAMNIAHLPDITQTLYNFKRWYYQTNGIVLWFSINTLDNNAIEGRCITNKDMVVRINSQNGVITCLLSKNPNPISNLSYYGPQKVITLKA